MFYFDILYCTNDLRLSRTVLTMRQLSFLSFLFLASSLYFIIRKNKIITSKKIKLNRKSLLLYYKTVPSIPESVL